jgi:hypothetical protein
VDNERGGISSKVLVMLSVSHLSQRLEKSEMRSNVEWMTWGGEGDELLGKRACGSIASQKVKSRGGDLLGSLQPRFSWK